MTRRHIFKFERCEVKVNKVRYKTLATFPSFDIAWKSANGMFVDREYNIIGCYIDPGDSINSIEAGFTVERANTLEEYRISELLGDNDNE